MPLYVYTDPVWQTAMFGLPLVLFMVLAMAPNSRVRADRACKLLGPLIFVTLVWVCCLAFSFAVVPDTKALVVNFGLVLFGNGSMVVITWLVFSLIARYEEQ